jgi:uncharacterized protein (TIGR02217 family)
MTFRNQPLDTCIADGISGGPRFVTIIAGSVDNEQRERLRNRALWRWDAAYAAREESVWRPLMAFFLGVGGRADSWPFRDLMDYQCSASESVLTAIDSTHWQMMKLYSVGSLTYYRTIVLPYGTVVAGGGTYTVGATTGIITKTGGADPTGFVTNFYKLCRFDVDQMDPRQVMHKPDGTLFIEWAAIPILEVRA